MLCNNDNENYLFRSDKKTISIVIFNGVESNAE